MGKRAHHDGVARDERVAWENTRVRRLYAPLGIPERTAIEFFHGPHSINVPRTFEFQELSRSFAANLLSWDFSV